MERNRQKKYDKKNMRTVSCRLPKDQADRFYQWCESKGITRYEAIRRYIMRTLRRNKVSTNDCGNCSQNARSV